MSYWPLVMALRHGWLALHSAVRICRPPTSDLSRASGFPISALPRRACPWFTGTTAYVKPFSSRRSDSDYSVCRERATRLAGLRTRSGRYTLFAVEADRHQECESIAAGVGGRHLVGGC